MAGDPQSSGLPLVAVVGRPNVGKSSLVNRVLGRREAIVDETPGVTRDRTGFTAEWAGRPFEIVDTGGLEAGTGELEGRVAEQARVAIEAADVIVLVVDVRSGPLEDDLLVADLLRRSTTPVLVAANKADDPADEPAAAAFHRLGLGHPHPISALHGRGSGDFLDALVARLPPIDRATSDAWASIAIVGRPNVGKSSILNVLLGETRSIVDETPGTTRDPVDSYLDLGDGRRIRFVDTAGMRRRVLIGESLEYFGFVRSRRALARADAVLMVVDVAEGVTALDQRIAADIVESGRACVVALNKWDRLSGDDVDLARTEAEHAAKLRFLPWATVVRTSATTGRGMAKLTPALLAAVESHRRRLPTAEVNRLVATAQEQRPHPRARGRSARILYAVQANVAPPTIVLFTTGRLEPAYRRYLENRLRASEPWAGSPLALVVRQKARRELKT
jgi:GTP-binding protein